MVKRASPRNEQVSCWQLHEPPRHGMDSDNMEHCVYVVEFGRATAAALTHSKEAWPYCWTLSKRVYRCSMRREFPIGSLLCALE